MAINSSIGNTMKKLREKSRLNQTQVARFLEVDQSNISKCESGERQFTVDMLEKLCNLYGCVLSEVVNEGASPDTLHFAFRTEAIEAEDLTAIADINKIALNIGQMRAWLEA